MNVRIYDVSSAGDEVFRATCDLRECFPDGNDDPEFIAALRELETVGRFWTGGGAAPLVLLLRDHDRQFDEAEAGEHE